MVKNILTRKLTWFVLGVLTGLACWAWYEYHVSHINAVPGLNLFGPPSAQEIQQAAAALYEAVEVQPPPK